MSAGIDANVASFFAPLGSLIHVRQKYMRVLTASFVVFLFGCQTNMPVKTASTVPDAVTIRPGMFLRVTVEHEPSLSHVFIVSDSGSISFPFLNTLAVAGRTPEEVAAEIKSGLEKDYMKQAVVSVEIVEKETALKGPFVF
jgi:protein involved in polysaccharide export with SLBB domain